MFSLNYGLIQSLILEWLSGVRGQKHKNLSLSLSLSLTPFLYAIMILHVFEEYGYPGYHLDIYYSWTDNSYKVGPGYDGIA